MMDELLKTIASHKKNNNAGVCRKLSCLIRHCKIDTVDELKAREEQYFDKHDDLQRLDTCFREYLADISHLEVLDQNENALLIALAKRYTHTDEIKDKYVCIILMYHIMEWGNLFPYQTYVLICEDRLK